MTLDKAKKIIKSECYIADLLNLDRTRMVNTALDTVIEAAEKYAKIADILTNADKIIESRYGCVIVEGYADVIDQMREVNADEE